MTVTNVLKCSDYLSQEQDAIIVSSVKRNTFEEKVVNITIKDNGVTQSVNVFASELSKAIENAINL